MGVPWKDRLTAEDKVQHAINQYLDLKRLLWFHVPNEGRRTKFEQFKAKYLGLKSGVSDLFILEPRGEYHGLIIELKADNVVVFNKNGTVRSGMINQNEFLMAARKKGYKAEFAIGFDEAKSIIDKYLKL